MYNTFAADRECLLKKFQAPVFDPGTGLGEEALAENWANDGKLRRRIRKSERKHGNGDAATDGLLVRFNDTALAEKRAHVERAKNLAAG